MGEATRSSEELEMTASDPMLMNIILFCYCDFISIYYVAKEMKKKQTKISNITKTCYQLMAQKN